MSSDVQSAIAKTRLVPVVVLQDAADAEPLAKALCAGGLPVAEVTFRTAAAADAIAAMRSILPEMLVGAGTVTSVDQVDAAERAGASFVVTPGFNPKVVARCIERGLPVVPGANAPGFVEAAMEFGLDLLKFFPAEPSGGVPFLKALAGPYPGIKFIPTGGIGKHNLTSYLDLGNVLACGGSWMVDPKLVAEGRFEEVRTLTAEAVALASGSR